MSLHEAVAEHFPHARPQESYLRAVAARLTPLGFDAANTIACVGVCRDEMTRSFVEGVQRSWGEAFNFSSLAGCCWWERRGWPRPSVTLPTASFCAATSFSA